MKKILYSGMTLLLLAACKGQVTQTEEERSAVPDEAIVTSSSRKYVFVSLGEGRFRKQEVVTGLSQQGYTQITWMVQRQLRRLSSPRRSIWSPCWPTTGRKISLSLLRARRKQEKNFSFSCLCACLFISLRRITTNKRI